MKEFHNLITNTTSLVGYIAVLMFAGAYVGGNQSYALDPALLKGSVSESRDMVNNRDAIHRISTDENRSIIITIDGRQYRAILGEEVIGKAEFQY